MACQSPRSVERAVKRAASKLPFLFVWCKKLVQKISFTGPRGELLVLLAKSINSKHQANILYCIFTICFCNLKNIHVRRGRITRTMTFEE